MWWPSRNSSKGRRRKAAQWPSRSLSRVRRRRAGGSLRRVCLEVTEKSGVVAIIEYEQGEAEKIVMVAIKSLPRGWDL